MNAQGSDKDRYIFDRYIYFYMSSLIITKVRRDFKEGLYSNLVK